MPHAAGLVLDTGELGAVDLRVRSLELFQLPLLLLLAKLLAEEDVVEEIEEGGPGTLPLVGLVLRRGDLAAVGDGVGVLACPDSFADQGLVNLERRKRCSGAEIY